MRTDLTPIRGRYQRQGTLFVFRGQRQAIYNQGIQTTIDIQGQLDPSTGAIAFGTRTVMINSAVINNQRFGQKSRAAYRATVRVAVAQ
jgi:hypothetical protein